MADIMSSAGTGASIGTAIMPGIGTAAGAGIGALVGWLQNRSDMSNEEKQAALNILNEHQARLNYEQATNPSRPFDAFLRGQRIAASEERPGLVDISGGLGQGGNFFQGRETREMDPAMAPILAAMRDPSTYGLREGKGGQLVFDPNAVHPLQLTTSSGGRFDFAAGESPKIQPFVPPNMAANNPPPPPAPQIRRPEEFYGVG